MSIEEHMLRLMTHGANYTILEPCEKGIRSVVMRMEPFRNEKFNRTVRGNSNYEPSMKSRVRTPIIHTKSHTLRTRTAARRWSYNHPKVK
ncbi:hypothetical protein K470DRAFT_256307 [Piedraia hortae CBS 480.64]|uniref:Uncharacterized protein n=1 Tax=Piedraia hortae CBS 480.64 TaxID=1314780 RepID=A0A6A7C3I2_9PEZI|nr:hypothetical protein K470DRAFT_256307 [Piedraia hortae CBS 480.64]